MLVKNLPTTNQTQILEVAIPTPLRQYYDYSLPEHMQHEPLLPGQRILVPFGARKIIGFLVSIKKNSNIPSQKLKPILKIIDKKPLFSSSLITLLQWASQYYHHPLGLVFEAALPNKLRKDELPPSFSETYWQLSPNAPICYNHLSRAPKQKELLHRLQQTSISQSELNRLGLTQAAKALLLKQWVEKQEKSLRLDSAFSVKGKPHYDLTKEQRIAIESICQASYQFKSFLLYGITGSGKTEVYLQVIERYLSCSDKQVLILIPEINLTPQTIARFQNRFKTCIAILNSRIGQTEKLKAWTLAKEGHARIVIGTRSAAFTELKSPGLFIIDEEHDNSYKQQDNFKYSARDLLIMRAKLIACPIILGTATPSLESLQNVYSNKYTLLSLSQRPGKATSPQMYMIDIRHKKLEAGLSPTLLQKIKTHLAQQNQIILFINRRGFAPVLMCYECGWHAHCRHCDARLIVHLQINQLCCHHCGHYTTIPTQCPDCQIENLNPLGIGTQRLEKVLKQHFPQARITRMDKDSTQKKEAFEAMMSDMLQQNIDILIGTQMLAKGHHFPNVTLVAIVDVDQALFSADFRSIEKMGQLITQVAGRAGRENKPGEVLLQTMHPTNPLLQTLTRCHYLDFCQLLLKERHAVQLPPFSFQLLVRAASRYPNTALSLLKKLKQSMPSQHAVTLLGPVPCVMEKKQNTYRAELLLQASHRQTLHQLMPSVTQFLIQSPQAKAVKWTIDIDPTEMY